MKEREMKGALTLPHNDLLEKRIDTPKITRESVMNCGRKVLGCIEDVKYLLHQGRNR
jgi:hypothetical protein